MRFVIKYSLFFPISKNQTIFTLFQQKTTPTCYIARILTNYGQPDCISISPIIICKIQPFIPLSEKLRLYHYQILSPTVHLSFTNSLTGFKVLSNKSQSQDWPTNIFLYPQIEISWGQRREIPPSFRPHGGFMKTKWRLYHHLIKFANSSSIIFQIPIRL